MEKYLVHGGASLKGEVTISGAKNAVAAILPAVILADGQFTIENVPSISDITVITKILQSMGAKIRMDQPYNSVYRYHPHYRVRGSL